MAALLGEETLRNALRSGRKIFAIAVAFSFLCNLLRLTGPIFILLVYDRVLPSRSEETLVVLFTLVAALLITMGMVDYARRRLLARFGAQFQERIENQILASTPKEEFFKTGQNKPTAGLSDLDSVRGFFNSSAIIAVLDVMWAPLFLAVVFTFHWILGWVVVAGLTLLTAMYLIKTSFAKDEAATAAAASKKVAALKNMLVKSKHAMKSQAMASSFADRWLLSRQNSRDSSIALKDWSSWFSVFSRQIKMFLQYSVLAVGAYLVLNGKITPGAMIASMFLSVRVFVPVDQFTQELPGIRRVLSNWKYLKTFFASRKENPEHEELWDLDSSLAITNLSKRSPLTGQSIFNSVNLTAGPREVLEITGASGAGKTALVETILGALPKNSGAIVCGGASIERLSLRQASDLFAYIPQSVRLVDGTIEENIAGLEASPDIDKVIKAAKLSQVHDMILSLPDGYQTKIESENDELSQGHRHKIALARALYKKPRILIIDEPDSFLQKAILSDDIRQAIDSAAIIVLSRRPIAGLNPDRKYRLEGGRLKLNKATENVVQIEKRNSKVSKRPGRPTDAQ